MFSIFSGYKAPEYASQGVYSLKTDVFSFGVLVLVIISGRRNIILDKQGDTVGDLVRNVSEHTFLCSNVCVDTSPIYELGFTLRFSNVKCIENISGLAYVEGPKVA